MRLFYISPSILPSRTANSVHVVHQCQGFSSLGVNVSLLAKRSVPDVGVAKNEVCRSYGVELENVELLTFYSHLTRGDNILIAMLALWKVLRYGKPQDLIVSRNLYASYVLAVLLRRKLVFETHQLEQGFRKRLQAAIMSQRNVVTVVISEKLRVLLADYHGFAPFKICVLHDAAPPGIEPLPTQEKRSELLKLVKDVQVGEAGLVCGYFGHLYPGRGIEIIEGMARARPDVVFLVFGGNEKDIIAQRANNTLDNLCFKGFVPHAQTQRIMAAVDVLLMPYQQQVSIGAGNQDTGRWMSPMKMFEYLASGTPIISSNLPVLCEVLKDDENALLVAADNLSEWVNALDRLSNDPAVAKQLGACAHACYAAEHTWTKRASRILESMHDA